MTSTTPAAMTIHEAAAKSLRALGTPTHLKELRTHIEHNGYFSFGAQQPERALGVSLDRHSRGVQISRVAPPFLFYRASPATYGLLEWLSDAQQRDLETDEEIIAAIEDDELDAGLFLEQELHEWLHKNVRENGLAALGLGRLVEVDPDRQGSKSGRFNTGVVGEIDMLLTTPTGDFVVIELKRRGDDQTIGQICRYYSWVREELCPPGRKVIGIVIAQVISEPLRYALRAVNADISVRQLQLDVRLGPPVR